MLPFPVLNNYGNTVIIPEFKGNYSQVDYTPLWSTRAEQGSCVDSSGNIYAVGGVNASSYYNDCWKYTASTDSWSSIAPYAAKRSAPAMAYDPVNDEVYSFGGSSATPALSNKTNDLYKYTVNTNTWSKLSPSGTNPGARVHAVMVYINGKMYIFGSYFSEAISKTISSYDILTNSYQTLSPAPYSLAYGSSAIVYGGNIITVGVNGSTYYLMQYNINLDSWNIISTTTIAIGRLSLYHSQIIAIGFNTGTLYKNKFTNDWETLSTIPNYAVNCQVFSNVNNKFILTLGGKTATGSTLTTSYKLT